MLAVTSTSCSLSVSGRPGRSSCQAAVRAVTCQVTVLIYSYRHSLSDSWSFYAPHLQGPRAYTAPCRNSYAARLHRGLRSRAPLDAGRRAARRPLPSLRASASSADAAQSGSEGPLERLRRSAPFFSSPELVASSVAYEGPLEKFNGAADYTAAMSSWKRDFPSRLEELKIENVQVFPVSEDVSRPPYSLFANTNSCTASAAQTPVSYRKNSCSRRLLRRQAAKVTTRDLPHALSPHRLSAAAAGVRQVDAAVCLPNPAACQGQGHPSGYGGASGEQDEGKVQVAGGYGARQPGADRLPQGEDHRGVRGSVHSSSR